MMHAGVPAYDFNFVARVRVGLANNETHLLADCPTFDEDKVPPAALLF